MIFFSAKRHAVVDVQQHFSEERSSHLCSSCLIDAASECVLHRILLLLAQKLLICFTKEIVSNVSNRKYIVKKKQNNIRISMTGCRELQNVPIVKDGDEYEGDCATAQ